MRRTCTTEEEDRTPVGRSDFKSGETRTTCLVGSTPTLFRQTKVFCPVNSKAAMTALAENCVGLPY